MTGQAGPLAHSVAVESVPNEGSTVEVKADAATCAALAALDNIVSVRDLVGRFRLRQQGRGGIRVTGTVCAVVTQTCTVSLDPFETDLSEDVDVTFLPEKGVAEWLSKRSAAADKGVMLEDEDPPDPIVDGRIDLGMLTAEFLALGLDPYPRKPGVVFDPGEAGDPDPSPFAALAALKPQS